MFGLATLTIKRKTTLLSGNLRLALLACLNSHTFPGDPPKGKHGGFPCLWVHNIFEMRGEVFYMSQPVLIHKLPCSLYHTEGLFIAYGVCFTC